MDHFLVPKRQLLTRHCSWLPFQQLLHW